MKVVYDSENSMSEVISLDLACES